MEQHNCPFDACISQEEIIELLNYQPPSPSTSNEPVETTSDLPTGNNISIQSNNLIFDFNKGVACTQTWQCGNNADITTAYNFVDCVNGFCQCK